MRFFFPCSHPLSLCRQNRVWSPVGIQNLVPRSYLPLLSFLSGKQHTRHCATLGDELSPHPKMVEIVLRPEPGVEKIILDIG